MLPWMCFCLASAAGLVMPADNGPAQVGWLWYRHRDVGPVARPYRAKEGDLVFFTTGQTSYWIAYFLARTGHPFHCGIVVRDRLGRLVVFEVGGAGSKEATLRCVEKRLEIQLVRYCKQKPVVWVRPRRQPLTPEQSARLTCFAESMRGKPFAGKRRLAVLGLPPCLNPRTRMNQSCWFCSEMVIQAMRCSGLLPNIEIEPSRSRPRDLFIDLYPDIAAGWEPAARWNFLLAPPPPGPRLAPW
jgi:hypothetical protein